MVALWKQFLVGGESQKGAVGRAGHRPAVRKLGRRNPPAHGSEQRKSRAALRRELLCGGEGRLACGSTGIPHREGGLQSH